MAGFHAILQPNFCWIHPQLFSNHVDLGVTGKLCLRTTESPHGRRRRLVCVDVVSIVPVVGNRVRKVLKKPGQVEGCRAHGIVRSAIENCPAFFRHQGPVLIETGFQKVLHRRPVACIGELFLPGVFDFHRLSRDHRKMGRAVLILEKFHLAAPRTADMR